MDKEGKLSQADKERLVRLIAEKQIPPGRPASACDICGNANWFVADHLVYSATIRPGIALGIGGPTYVCAQIVCTNCGHTKLVNAYAVGFLVPNAPLVPDEESAA